MRMTASSLRPMRRASTSALPAAVSNRQRFPSLTSGTGNGHSSLPMTSVLPPCLGVDELPAFGERGGEGLAIAARGHRIGGVDELLAVGAEDRGQLLARRPPGPPPPAPAPPPRASRTSAAAAAARNARTPPSPRAPRAINAEAIVCFCMAVDLSRCQRRRPAAAPAAPAALPSRAGRPRRAAARIPGERVGLRAAAFGGGRGARCCGRGIGSCPRTSRFVAASTRLEWRWSSSAPGLPCAPGPSGPASRRDGFPGATRPDRCAAPTCSRAGRSVLRIDPRGDRPSPRARLHGGRSSRPTRRCTCSRRRASRTDRSSSRCRWPRRSQSRP